MHKHWGLVRWLGKWFVVLKGRGRDFAPAGESLSCPRQESDQRSASADSYPAELAALLRRSAHTAAGNQKDILAVRDACACVGTNQCCVHGIPMRMRENLE